MNGMITTNADFDLAQVLPKLKAYTTGKVVEKVTCQQKYTVPGDGFHVALMDFGTKKNIVKSLNKLGCQVTVYPALTTAEEILADSPDGVMLCNGPGDPKECTSIIEELQKLYHRPPDFRHLSRPSADGVGHRGGHPQDEVRSPRRQPSGERPENRKVYISSQNHGYVVNTDTVDPAVAEVSFVSVNDGTAEGLRYKNERHDRAVSSGGQPGPLDTGYLFDEFINLMGGSADAEK